MGLSSNPIRLSGKKVLQLRNKFKISQECLASEINLTECVIVKIESDKSKEVTLCTAYKLAKFFNVPIEYLIE